MTALIAVLIYGAILFAIASACERRGLPGWARRGAYPLSLAVYCSSWTFFGGVGTAATSGWNYLSIYLGPILLFLFAPAFLDRIVVLAHAARSTSIADFLSARYGHSRRLAAIVTGFAVVASVPYIALQLRSVSSSFGALVGIQGQWPLGTLVALLLALFAISFGARRYEVSGRNDGVVAAVAVESLMKLVVFVILGGFALLLYLRAPDAIRAVGVQRFAMRFGPGGPTLEFVVQTALAAAAVICLPRQFYIGVVEAEGERPVARGRWLFLGYLVAISLLVLPLALAGLTLLPPSASADLIVLSLPLSRGADMIALLAFLGGFSAATAMVIVETIALSTMATNDLIAPLILARSGTGGEADLGRRMLAARRGVIVAIIAAALLYGAAIDGRQSLASIGLIAFAGVAQFAPALVATVAFGFRDARAAIAGLFGGLIGWTWCLLLPSIGQGAVVAVLRDASGGWLDPAAPFGIDSGATPLVTGVLISLGLNIALMALFRLEGARRPGQLRHGGFAQVTTLGEIRTLVARFVGDAEAGDAFDRIRVGPNDAGDPSAPISGFAARRAEQLIAGVIGASSARLIVTSSMAGAALDVGDVVRLLDESGQSLQFSRGLLSATLAAIDPGVSVIDSNLRLVAWNPRYREMFDYPDDYVAVGRPIADLIRYNAVRGDCAPGDLDTHVARRLAHLSRGTPHSFERQRPSGRWIKTVGGPMPGGGYVMSFTDITAEKEAQAELERRVADRTRELAAAKTLAETATRDKTRFLAAASHDLVQPLHAARLFCAALDREIGAAQAPLLRRIEAAIGSADTLLGALLDVSRLDSGGFAARMAVVDLTALIAALATEFAPLAAERGLGLHVHAGRAPILVRTDRALVRSILQNLLSNAVRHTAEGRVWIGARRRGGLIRVEVRDSGPGIAPADQARIFREFVRVETRGNAGAGVGLGLAIVERSARLLDAPLELRSTVGRGSVFAVSLAAG